MGSFKNKQQNLKERKSSLTRKNDAKCCSHTVFSTFLLSFLFFNDGCAWFLHSHTETITMFWRERNACKDQQTAPDWGRAAVGRERSAQSWQGPPSVLLSSSTPPPCTPASPGALPNGASSPGREAEPPQRKSEYVYWITIRALPMATIRRPTPLSTPI